MKTLINTHKYKKNDKSAYALNIKDLPEELFDQVMAVVSQTSHEVVKAVDDTKNIATYPYENQQCKMTGVHMSRRDNNENCAFCGHSEGV
jgi:hypothetical protein